MQKKLWNKARRVLAGLMAVAMVLVNFSDVAVYADETTGSSTAYTFNAADLTAAEDKEDVKPGTVLATNFTSEGTVTKRLKDSTDPTKGVKSVEVGKNASGAVSFVVTGTAEVSVVASSTSGSNTSTVALVNANGEAISNQEEITEVTTTSATTLTYTGLAAGVYKVVSPVADYGRGARVYSITVVDAVAGTGDDEGKDGTPVEIPTEWSFTGEDYDKQESYNGLTISGGSKHSADYGMQISNGTIVVPVAGPCDVEVGVGYTWQISFDDSTEVHHVTTDSGHQTLTYSYTGEAGTVTIKAGADTTSYIKSIKVVAKTVGDDDGNDDTEGETLTVPASEIGKIDVYDLAAEQLDSSKYVNKLSEGIINSWFPGVEAGTEGKNLATFQVKDAEGNVVFGFNDGGYPATHRLRTMNTNLTRYDAKNKTFGGTTYNGFIYSNKAASSDVYVELYVEGGDIVTLAVSSNGTAADYVFEAPSGEKQTGSYDAVEAGTLLTFYGKESGLHKLYTTKEKLVLLRAYVQHTPLVKVSGAVSAPAEIPAGYAVTFTNTTTGVVTEAVVANGTYTADLHEAYTYEVALKDANGYVVTSADKLALGVGEVSAKTFDVTVQAVTLVEVTGSFVGISTDIVKDMTIKFVSEEIFVPTITINGTRYSTQLEVGTEYAVEISGINDYELVGPATIKAAESMTQDIEIAKKPVYAVTINPTGATAEDLAEATFTFTNLNEEGYVYTFTGTEGIVLRDGVYGVKVENSGAFVQKLTSNLKVNGAAVTKTIGFESDIKEWVFTDASFTSGKYANALSTAQVYNGLSFVNGKSHNNTYLYMGAGSVSVPVKGDCTVTVNACYQYSFYFENETEASVNVKTGSTSQIDSFSYNYKGGEGTVDITFLGTSYVNSIKITENIEYKDTVTVGATGCDYTTIDDALDAVRAMPREDGQRVTIEIQPGDYEEMLVIDVPNVTLKNASKTPSIATKDKGVNIDENAVRITSYYGHGYTYYSMGSDCKYDEEILAVNKENGYASFENPGSGTTNGSYWNATVVISTNGFEAEGIIFENSFNQYVSKKAANDVIVAQSSAKEGSVPRAKMQAGDTTVQDKKYVERAAALAIANNCKEVFFDNCKFIGRQDTLYGGTDVTAAFYDCAIYGGTDYIFGGMTAVFAKCDLVFNTSENKDDVGYITAAQTKSGRGMLMYNCTVTSTVPGVDTASEYPSKAGYFGRPWQANTGEAVFYNTIIEATDSHWYEACPSLIHPVGWNSTLSGESVMSAEYGTYEMAADVDNQSARASWATTLSQQPILSDGTVISVPAFLGTWMPFEGKDMDIVLPDGKVDNTPEVEPEAPSATTKFVLDAADVATFASNTKVDGDTETAGTNNYFTLLYSASAKVEAKEKKFEDGYVSTQRINFGSGATTGKDAIKFTTSNPATVKVWWAAGDAAREMTILNSAGTAVATTSEGTAKDALYISELELKEAGTYYLGGTPKKNYIFKVEVTETPGGAVKPPRADWSTVAAPAITNIALNTTDANTVEVTVNANVGYDGADKITVVMTDAEGNEIASRNSLAEKTEHVLSFAPEASGTYTFAVKAIRDGEADKAGAETKTFDFTLPLVAPVITGAFNAGAGIVEVEWNAVKEATSYEVTVDGTDIRYTTENLTQIIEGLTVGETYTIKVAAVRDEEKVSASTAITVEDTKEVKWYFAAYGSSTNTKDNGYEVLDDGSVRVYSTNGKGKIVPGSTDGLAYYYTTIDPETTNFTLSATAVVNEWTLSNGQEGFGIMASDRAGKHGDGTAFWNNAYMAIVSKVEYYFDLATGEVTDDSSVAKVSMKLGVGSQEKIGVTAENLAEFDANNTAVINEHFASTTTTLESSCGAQGAGTYNIVGNYKGTEPTGTVGNTVTEFKFTIQKNNTGYFVSYTDAEGNTTTQKYYDTEALSQIEKDSVCLGFFASRNADVTFKDITFTTIAPQEDAPAEERPVTLVTPNFAITSATVANSADYELVYVGNADGTLVIKNNAGKVLLKNTEVKANEKVTLDVKLALGNNTYKITFTPDADYVPGEYQKLSSYEAVSFKHVVNYKAYGEEGTSIYVSPSGKSSGNGTKEKPLDIYTAVKYVQAGQSIVIMEGTYNLKSTVKVERGIDGTAENMIYMVADPESKTRPVFDFGGRCAGMVLAGDYWYFKGFDVTRSADAQKGIQVSGNNNVLDQINAYRNGNTGIQISRYLSTDNYEDWPANNLILNCTSYLNADKGYEDADGFAAKLTVGDGNVFDGCIAYYNADDGWDLFAKVQTGCIGAVTIQNCLAYKNGYDLDENGKEINAGNGNGFKMGGDSMAGGHILKNSIAFFNKAKGIDSNSCPDIKVYNSIAFNNGSYNVAFYTNTAANTDYYADGIISYRTENLGQAEQLKLVGSQNQSKVYGTSNYYWDATAGASMNSAGAKVSDAWFESLTFTSVDRNADGTINMHGFLELTETATVGGGLGGTSSSDVEIGEETSGKIQNANKVQQTTGTVVDTVDTIINAESKEEVEEAISDMISDITDIWNEEDETVEEENRQEVAEETCKKAEELVKELIEVLITGDNKQSGISEETAANIVTAVENGEEIVSEVVVKTIETKNVPKTEKDAIEKALKDSAEGKTEIVQYLDVSVLICTGKGEVLGNYTELNEKLTFTIAIPDDVDVEGKTFYVVRVHGDDVTRLDTVLNADRTVSFKTDRFSTYALAYEEEVQAADVDEKAEVETPSEVDVEIEEDNSSMLTIGAIAALFLAVCSLIIVRRRQSLNQ